MSQVIQRLFTDISEREKCEFWPSLKTELNNDIPYNYVSFYHKLCAVNERLFSPGIRCIHVVVPRPRKTDLVQICK